MVTETNMLLWTCLKKKILAPNKFYIISVGRSMPKAVIPFINFSQYKGQNKVVSSLSNIHV